MGPLVYNHGVASDFGITHVAHMISSLHGGWNRSLLEMLFPQEIVASVLAIMLPAVRCPDMLFWPEAQNGHYSTKLGYRFVMGIKTGEAPSPHPWVSSLRLSGMAYGGRQFCPGARSFRGGLARGEFQ